MFQVQNYTIRLLLLGWLTPSVWLRLVLLPEGASTSRTTAGRTGRDASGRQCARDDGEGICFNHVCNTSYPLPFSPAPHPSISSNQ